MLSTFLNNWGQVFCSVKLESNKDVALQDRRTSELNSLFKQVDERRKVIYNFKCTLICLFCIYIVRFELCDKEIKNFSIPIG